VIPKKSSKCIVIAVIAACLGYVFQLDIRRLVESDLRQRGLGNAAERAEVTRDAVEFVGLLQNRLCQALRDLLDRKALGKVVVEP